MRTLFTNAQRPTCSVTTQPDYLQDPPAGPLIPGAPPSRGHDCERHHCQPLAVSTALSVIERPLRGTILRRVKTPKMGRSTSTTAGSGRRFRRTVGRTGLDPVDTDSAALIRRPLRPTKAPEAAGKSIRRRNRLAPSRPAQEAGTVAGPDNDVRLDLEPPMSGQLGRHHAAIAGQMKAPQHRERNPEPLGLRTCKRLICLGHRLPSAMHVVLYAVSVRAHRVAFAGPALAVVEVLNQPG